MGKSVPCLVNRSEQACSLHPLVHRFRTPSPPEPLTPPFSSIILRNKVFRSHPARNFTQKNSSFFFEVSPKKFPPSDKNPPPFQANIFPTTTNQTKHQPTKHQPNPNKTPTQPKPTTKPSQPPNQTKPHPTFNLFPNDFFPPYWVLRFMPWVDNVPASGWTSLVWSVMWSNGSAKNWAASFTRWSCCAMAPASRCLGGKGPF